MLGEIRRLINSGLTPLNELINSFVDYSQDRFNYIVNHINDRLDVKVSSRAPASTALSNTVWTNARGGVFR